MIIISQKEWKVVNSHLGLKRNEKNTKIFSKIDAHNLTPAQRGIGEAIDQLKKMKAIINTKIADKKIDPLIKALTSIRDRMQKLILSPNDVFIVDEWLIYQKEK